MEKLEIKEYLHTFDRYSFDGRMEEIAKIFDFKKWWKNAYKAVPEKQGHVDKYHRFVMDADMNYGYDNEAWMDFQVSGMRWETDEELKKREEANKKRSESAKKAAKTKEIAKEKREKTLYENLKKKFEK